MISEEKKEEVRMAADIVDVVSDYVKLRRSGSGFVGLCPFHNEKTPSFHVTPRLGIYKCFGCGAGGDVFNFIMEKEGIGFTEAIRTLASRYGIFIPEEKEPEYDAQHHLREGIYHALRFAGLFFYRNLIETDEAEKARIYLQKRGLTKETIKKYGLGYAPESWKALYKSAIDAGLNEEYLKEAGLIKYGTNGENVYDTFRGRLMFPIFNPSGKVIAFGGRVLDKSKTAKYINSPQTLVYNKSEVLYGIQVAKNEIRKENEAILVEGYMDVLSLHQAGIRNAVSTSGTSLTPNQLRRLHRYSENLLMIYDSDAAGQKAMERGLDIVLSEGLVVRLLQLPEGEDPDSFIKQFGGQSFIEYKNKGTEDFLTFILGKAMQQGDLDEKLVTRLIYSISHIPDIVAKERYIRDLIQKTGFDERSLREKLRVATTELRGDKVVKNDDKTQWAMEPYEKEIIRLMLEYGRKMVEYIGSLCNSDHFENKQLKIFFEDIIKRYQDDKEISVEVYMAKEQPYPRLVSEIVMEAYGVSEKGVKRTGVVVRKDVDPYKTAKGALKSLKMHYLNRLNRQFNNTMKTAKGDEKKRLNEMILHVAYERARLERLGLNDLFPDPPDADPELE